MNIVTGMHRSGTSMIANMLYELGADFGDPAELLEADPWNPRGYWEYREVFILNEHILLGDWPPTRQFWTTKPADRSILLRLVMTAARIQYVALMPWRGRIVRRAAKKADLIRQAQEAYSELVVKDPRFSLLTGEWAKVVPVKKVLYCYRHPAEVARSLNKRGATPMPVNYWMWQFHVGSFLETAAGVSLVMVNYNNFFDEDRRMDEVKRLFTYLDRPYDEAAAQNLLAHVLDNRLKKNTHSDETLPGRVAGLYGQLSHLHEKHDTLKPLELRRP